MTTKPGPTRPGPLRIPARRAAAALLALGLSLVAGCGNELPAGLSRKTVTVSELPDPVAKAAKKAVPGVNFTEAWTNVARDGALHSYEIRGRTANGKIREVRVSPSGEILEME